MEFRYFLTVSALVIAAAVPAVRAEDMPSQFRTEHCTMCHSVDHKMVGPSYKDIAAKYRADATALDKLKKKVREGGGGVWGAAKMPPHPKTTDSDLDVMIKWILALT